MTVLPDRHAGDWLNTGSQRFIRDTAIEHGWQIVTADRPTHEYPAPRRVATR